MAITLEELLEARDNRRLAQLSMIEANPDKTLVVLTVNIPGSEKRTPDSLVVGREGVKALECALHPESVEVRDLITGFEAFLLVRMDRQEAKKLSVGIETGHPLGRLMDIDVFDTDGTPVSRTALGHASRRCLICGEDARVCMRTFAHTQSELQDKIHSIVKAYVQRH